MIDLEEMKKEFKDHKATLTDYDNIKIVDFKKPNTNCMRIRFLFDEKYYTLHITGDCGELTAINYINMTYDRFKGFVDKPSYFEQKVTCHSQYLHLYDKEKAESELMDIIERYKYEYFIRDKYSYSVTKENAIRDFIADVLTDFDVEEGISEEGYENANDIIDDFWRFSSTLGKEETGIIDLYLLAFKLAKEQLDKQGV